MTTATITRRVVPAHGPWPPDVSPVLQRVFAARGVLAPEDAELRLARLLPPDSLGNLDHAVGLLAVAIAAGKHIVVVGDFDCDGATGTAVAVRGLRMLGATRVSFQVPHRITHGYGLSTSLVADMEALEPDLLLTVDSGIACHAGIAAAKARGWQVLVSDHHLPGPTLPDADAIVNPNLRGDAFPSKAMAGVGVVFYLLLALRRHLRGIGESQAGEADLSTLLDLVAVGTIADLVPLDFNNRLMVSAGLRRMRQGKCQPGLAALAEVAGRPLGKLSASDIGFCLAPRLNAAGRLEDMSLGIECLLCDQPARARELADVLDRINAERRNLQQEMVDQAEALLETLVLSGDLPAGLALFDPGWHPGVIGLVASKVKERVNRPAIAFAPAAEDPGKLRGSARSIAGFHVRDALALVDSQHPGLIDRFGGHAMAAGLTLGLDQLPRFREAFVRVAAEALGPALLDRQLASDGPLDAGDICRPLAEALEAAGPWGQSFEEPLFDNTFLVRDWKLLGGKHVKLVLGHVDGGDPISAIQFGGWTGQPPPGRIHAAFNLALDDYGGRKGVQLLVRQWTPA